MKILAAAGDIGSLIAEIRLRAPLQALADETGWSVTWRSFHDCRRADLHSADVLVVQRGASSRVWRLQRAMQASGGAVVYEIDDLLTEIAPHISQHAAVRASLPWLKRCLAQADLVTVSTQPLQRALAPLARATALVPNFAFQDQDRSLPTPQPGQPVHLLVASSDHLLAPELTAALDAVVGADVRLVVVGPPGAALEAAGLALVRHPLMSRERFMMLARSLPNAVAAIPLEASRFAACKSAVKWYDYAEAGIPTLASDVPPYADEIRHNLTGALVPNTAPAWEQALRLAIADAAWRTRIAAQARAAVRERHLLVHTVAAWTQALLLAQRRRVSHAPVDLTAWQMLAAGLGSRLDDAAIAIRGLNRQRLARRHKPPA